MSATGTAQFWMRPAKMQRTITLAFVLTSTVILGFLMISGCKKQTETETVVTVKVEHPEQGIIVEHTVADAVLAPQAQAALTPKITAPVKKFFVQKGDRVKAGQLLAKLESNDLTAAAMENKGSYLAAQAAYDTTTKAQVPEDVQKAELDMAQARANLELNQSIVKSRKQLFAQGAIPGRDLDTAQAALVQAQAAYDTAAKHLESMQKISREAALKSAQGQLTSAEGRYKGAKAQAGYAEIRSPISGVITDRPLYEGETAAAGVPLLTVMDTSILLAKTHLAASVARTLKVGGSASVIPAGLSNPVAGKIQMISPALDSGSTTVEVWVKIDNRSGELKAGTPVKISISGRREEHAWKIPAKSILRGEDGSKYVMVAGADGMAHRKNVKLGLEDSEDVQVLSGISPSDSVIIEGEFGLEDGAKVKVEANKDNSSNPESDNDTIIASIPSNREKG
jgi:HlyD family secretion protein